MAVLPVVHINLDAMCLAFDPEQASYDARFAPNKVALLAPV